MTRSVPAAASFLALLLTAGGCWRAQDGGQTAPDGGDTDTEDTDDTDGITDPDTGWVGQWTYTEMETPVTQDLAAVWGTWFGNVWAVGEDGVILHFDGTGWTEESGVPTSLNLHAVAGLSSDRIWVAGADRVLVVFNGSWWQQEPTAFDPSDFPGGWRGLCARSSEWAFAVGESATLAIYDGSDFGGGVVSEIDADFHAVWCAAGTDAFIAGHNHSAFSSSVLLRFTPETDQWQLYDHQPSDNMYGIAGYDEDHVWAVGFDDGVGSKLYRKNDDSFTVEETSDHELLGLWAHATLGVWAVGNTADDDAIGVVEAWDTNGDLQYELEYDGTTRLRGIWGVDNVSDKHLFAVGKNGTILHIYWDPL